MTLRQLVKKLCFFVIALGLTVSFAPAAFSADANDIPRMTIEELKAKMDRGEDIVILDVRSGEDYTSSKVKIKGAIRIPLDQLESRYKELSAEREIIAYCA